MTFLLTSSGSSCITHKTREITCQEYIWELLSVFSIALKLSSGSSSVSTNKLKTIQDANKHSERKQVQKNQLMRLHKQSSAISVNIY